MDARKRADISRQAFPYGSVREAIDSFEKDGRLCFLDAELSARVPHATEIGRDHALIRLARSGRVLRTSRGAGHWLIVPLNAARLGAPPLESWLDHYMTQALQIPYLVGLLSASEHHGASPYAVMQTQVFVPRPRRSVTAGRIQLVFHARDKLSQVPWIWHESADGRLRVSTPEITSIDLIRFMSESGGLARVEAVLKDLLPNCQPAKLIEALEVTQDITATQRLGALCVLLGHNTLGDTVEKWLHGKEARLHWRALSPEQDKGERTSRDMRFRIWMQEKEDAGA